MANDRITLLKERVASEIPVADIWNFITGQNVESGTDVGGVKCPLHGDGNDDKPSAKVYGESSNHVWCWVCKRKWDSIALIQLRMGLSFPNAVEELAKRLSDGGSSVASVQRQSFRVKKNVDNAAVFRIHEIERAAFAQRHRFDLETYCRLSVGVDRSLALARSGKDSSRHEELLRGLVERHV